MKLFAFGDTHGVTDFSYLVARAQEADVLLCVGDVTEFGRDVPAVVEALASLARSADKPLVITHGNHEGRLLRAALRVHAPQIVYLHNSTHDLGDALFFGFGGGGFRTRDGEVEAFLRSAHSDHSAHQGLVVWVFHGPPRGCVVDEVPGIGSTGCFSKRALMDELVPHVVFCGHIHEQFGVVKQVGDTVVVNPGPQGVLVDVAYSNTNSMSTSSSGDSK